jgi:hypothetical protein
VSAAHVPVPAGLALCLLLAAGACARSPQPRDASVSGGGPVAFAMVRHPVSGVEVPQIAFPERPGVEQAVNQELDSVAADLRCDPEQGGEFDSTLHVTHAANDVFSVSIRATIFCSGLAYPTLDADFSMTFDLWTGEVVPFRELFADYERDFVAIAEVYRATIPADREGCWEEHTVETLESYGFGYTLASDGLTVRPEFPHVIAACADEGVLPFDQVQALAVRGGILERVANAAGQRTQEPENTGL